MNHTIRYRSKEDVFDNVDGVDRLRQDFSSTLSVPLDGHHSTHSSSSRNLRANTQICHSSTPKIAKRTEILEPANLFSSNDVSPVVPRDTNTYGSLRNNMVQKANPAITTNVQNENIYNINNSSSSMASHFSLINSKHVSSGSGVIQATKGGVLINPVQLHQEQVKMMNESDARSHLPIQSSTYWGHPSHHNIHSTTNFDTNTTKLLHENKFGSNTFSIARKVAPTAVDYNCINGGFTKPIINPDRARSPCVYSNKFNLRNENSRDQRRASLHEQMLWSGLYPASINNVNIRKLSSPVQLGGISMEKIGATENSIYLRNRAALSGFNRVFVTFKSIFFRSHVGLHPDPTNKRNLLCSKL